MSRNRLLNVIRCVITSAPSSPVSSGVACSNRVWPAGRPMMLPRATEPIETKACGELGQEVPSPILAAVGYLLRLTDKENPHKVLDKRGILLLLATNTMTKVLAN
jgi:hypothetical protein